MSVFWLLRRSPWWTLPQARPAYLRSHQPQPHGPINNVAATWAHSRWAQQPRPRCYFKTLSLGPHARPRQPHREKFLKIAKQAEESSWEKGDIGLPVFNDRWLHALGTNSGKPAAYRLSQCPRLPGDRASQKTYDQLAHPKPWWGLVATAVRYECACAWASLCVWNGEG